MKVIHRSKVYTDRPAYADFDAPAKFEAIKSIIAKRLREHSNAICSYSGGVVDAPYQQRQPKTWKGYGHSNLI